MGRSGGAACSIGSVGILDQCRLRWCCWQRPVYAPAWPPPLARELACDQPLNVPGYKTGCHERTDTYLQPVDDYVAFLLSLHPADLLLPTGVWPLPALEAGGQLFVVQDPRVAGSAGLSPGQGALAACQAPGDPSLFGQPQQRLSRLAAAFSQSGWPVPVVSICDPQSYLSAVGAALVDDLRCHIELLVLPGAPQARPDGSPLCLVGDVPFGQPDAAPDNLMPVCSASCCAAMPANQGFCGRWGTPWSPRV